MTEEVEVEDDGNSTGEWFGTRKGRDFGRGIDVSRLADLIKDDVATDAETYRLIYELVKAGSKVAVSMALMMMGADIAILFKEQERLKETSTKFNDIYIKFNKELDRAKGLIDVSSIRRTLDDMRALHRVNLIVNPVYRRQVEDWNKSVHDIALDVFGEASTLRSGLVLTQMMVSDISTLAGRPTDLNDAENFSKALEVTTMVQTNARKYSRNPSAFWFDLDNTILKPLFNERGELQQARDAKVSTLSNYLDLVASRSTAIDKRFVEYRNALDPFLSDEQVRELDQMRRDYRSKVLTPLATLQTDFDTIFPIQEQRIQTVFDAAESNRKDIEEVKPIVAQPNSLTPEKKAAQRERINSIWDEVATPTDEPVGSTDKAFGIVNDIFDQFEKDQ